MQDDPLVRRFDRLARQAPAAAVVAAPGRTCSRSRLDAMARAATQALARNPPPPAAPVGLQAPGLPAFLAGLLALRRAGHPVILLDAGMPPPARRDLAGRLGFSVCLTVAGPWPTGPGDWRLEGSGPHPAPGPEGIEADTAVIKLTSGSCGAARGIGTPARALLADDAALAATMGLGPEDRLLAAIPLSHSYGLSSLAVPALARGTLLVVPADGSPLAPLRAAAACGATVFPTVPALVGALARLAEPAPVPASLRLILSAGAPLSGEVAARFRQRYGRAVHVFYGASECGGICYDRTGRAAEEGTVGEPVEGVRIHLLSGGEEEPGTGPVADGVAGRVVVRSPAVARAYLPVATPDLRAGRFASQDRARWAGRSLVLEGRLDQVINVRGRNVDPSEVERVLTALHAVDEAAVVGLPAADGGTAALHAVVACRRETLTVEKVLAWCREHLSDYKVPRSIRLVRRLPRTERGKIDRAALRGPEH